MPHNFASLNWCSDCEISVDEETTELYGKNTDFRYYPQILYKKLYLEEIYKIK